MYHTVWLGWIPRIFRSFFLCLDMIIWPYYYARTPREVQKKFDFFRFFLNFLEFFRLFRGFLYKTFLYSELQSRAIHRWILLEILRRKNFVKLLCDVVQNCYIPKTVQNGGFTRVEIAWVHSKSNKPTLKSISKSPDGYW